MADRCVLRSRLVLGESEVRTGILVSRHCCRYDRQLCPKLPELLRGSLTGCVVRLSPGYDVFRIVYCHVGMGYGVVKLIVYDLHLFPLRREELRNLMFLKWLPDTIDARPETLTRVFQVSGKIFFCNDFWLVPLPQFGISPATSADDSGCDRSEERR